MYLQIRADVIRSFSDFEEGFELPVKFVFSDHLFLCLSWADSHGREVRLVVRNDYGLLYLTSERRRVDCIEGYLNGAWQHPFLAQWDLKTLKTGSVAEISRQVQEQLNAALYQGAEWKALPQGAGVVDTIGTEIHTSSALVRKPI